MKLGAKGVPRSFSEGGRSCIIPAMWYVYIIKSIPYLDQRYIGITDNLDARLKKHNQGASNHTSKFRPWKLHVVIGFTDKQRALAFEKYLKSGSGYSFAKKHF